MSAFFAASAAVYTSNPAASAFAQDFDPSYSPIITWHPDSFAFKACACPWLPYPITAIVFPSNNVLNNRIYGDDRQETNGKVIEKFYTSSSYENVLVSKSDPLVDALTAGPLAAKLKSPIVIVGNSVSETQNNILGSKKASLVYEIGGGVNTNSINTIIELLK